MAQPRSPWSQSWSSLPCFLRSLYTPPGPLLTYPSIEKLFVGQNVSGASLILYNQILMPPRIWQVLSLDCKTVKEKKRNFFLFLYVCRGSSYFFLLPSERGDCSYLLIAVKMQPEHSGMVRPKLPLSSFHRSDSHPLQRNEKK